MFSLCSGRRPAISKTDDEITKKQHTVKIKPVVAFCSTRHNTSWTALHCIMLNFCAWLISYGSGSGQKMVTVNKD